MLISVLLPVLGRVRQLAEAEVCQANQKALIIAWRMYADDNSGNLVGGVRSGYGGQDPYSYGLKPASDSPWICAPTVEDTSGGENHRSLYNGAVELSNENAIEYRKFGIKVGKLWQYTNDYDLYHCPSDEGIMKNAPYNSFVSYSITGPMNGEDIRLNWNGVRPYTNVGQIKPPAEKMVFIEEKTQGQNYLMGSFLMQINGSDPYNLSSWWDYPAAWHDSKTTMSFADGHVEMIEWESEKNLRYDKPGSQARI